MANVDLVDLLPILKAILRVKEEYKQALNTTEVDFGIYPVLTENFLDNSYNQGYEVGFKQCLTDYLNSYEGIEILRPRPMREVVPTNFSDSGDQDYDTLTDIMVYCLGIRQNLKTILDLDTDLFELYPPQLITLAGGQYAAGLNDGYIAGLSYIEGMTVLPPTINYANNYFWLTSSQSSIPTLELFYKVGSLDGEWIPYQLGMSIPIEDSTRVYAYAKAGTKNSEVASRLCEYDDFLAPTISFSNNSIYINSNYYDGSGVKTKYKLSTWENYNDFVDYDNEQIPITETATVWAYNYLGNEVSATVSNTYTPTVTPVTKPSTPTIYFSPETNIVTISCSTPGAKIYFHKEGSNAGWIEYNGSFKIVEDGTYTAMAVLDGIESDISSPVVCDVSISGGGVTPSTQPQVFAPTLFCNSNKIYVYSTQSGVTLYLMKTRNIHYGGGIVDPANNMNTDTWYEYTTPVPISMSGTYKAKAVLNSDNTKAAYSVDVDCIYSNIEPGSGSNPGGGSGSSTDEYVAPPLMSCNDSVLTINPVTPGSVAYYREKGTETWIQYSSPITINTDWTYEAYATKNGYNSSISELYCETQIPVAPTISCTTDGRVTMSTPSQGATILYKKNTDTVWSTYQGPFNIYETETYQSKAVRNGYESSVVTHECEVVSTLITISFNQNLLSIHTDITNYDVIQYKKNRDSEWITYNGPTLFDETTLYDARVIRYGTQLAITTKECVYVAPVSMSFNDTTNSLTLTTSEVEGTIKYKKNTESSWSTYSGALSVLETTVYEAKTVKNGYESNISSLRCIPSSQIDYSEEYFTIELTHSNAYITINDDPEITYPTIYYSVNNGSWNTLADDVVFSRGDAVRLKSDYWYNYTFHVKNSLNEDVKFITYGNILSLIAGDNFDSGTLGYNQFGSLFRNSKITSAKNLILPSSVNSNFYKFMFDGCSELIEAPVLPAMTLNIGCYAYMFSGCTSLVNAPNLPATILARECYENMFSGCTSLVNAPNLPATNVYYLCYASMFRNCTSLVNAPNLPATILAEQCYDSMFYACTSLVNAPTIAAATLDYYCCQKMFYGCTSLVNGPTLLAVTLSYHSYDSMFYRCTSLISLKCMAENNISGNTNNWLYNVSSTGTFTKKTGVSWSSGASGIPTGWTVEESNS